jgi:hypothetical protein
VSSFHRLELLVKRKIISRQEYNHNYQDDATGAGCGVQRDTPAMPGEKPANSEIEVTPEMVAAGVDVISGHWLDITAEVEPMPLSEVAQSVFVAIQKARGESFHQVP